MNHNEKNAMSRILKIAAALAVLASLGACTVVPPRVAYSGPSVGIVVGPAPYYAAPYYAPHARPPTMRHPPMVAIGAGVATAIVTGSAVKTQRPARARAKLVGEDAAVQASSAATDPASGSTIFISVTNNC